MITGYSIFLMVSKDNDQSLNECNDLIIAPFVEWLIVKADAGIRDVVRLFPPVEGTQYMYWLIDCNMDMTTNPLGNVPEKWAEICKKNDLLAFIALTEVKPFDVPEQQDYVILKVLELIKGK